MMMKTLAAAFLASALAIGNVAMVRADGKCGMCGKMDAGKKVDKLTLLLDLNDKQKAAVKDLVDAKIKKLEPAMDQLKKQHEEASESFEAGLKKVLSPAQAKKFDSWKDMEKEKCDH